MKLLFLLLISMPIFAQEPVYEDTVAVIRYDKIFIYHCTDTHVYEVVGYGLILTKCREQPETRPTPPLPAQPKLIRGFELEALLTDGTLYKQSRCFVRQRTTDEEVEVITLDCRPLLNNNRK